MQKERTTFPSTIHISECFHKDRFRLGWDGQDTGTLEELPSA